MEMWLSWKRLFWLVSITLWFSSLGPSRSKGMLRAVPTFSLRFDGKTSQSKVHSTAEVCNISIELTTSPILPALSRQNYSRILDSGQIIDLTTQGQIYNKINSRCQTGRDNKCEHLWPKFWPWNLPFNSCVAQQTPKPRTNISFLQGILGPNVRAETRNPN